MKKLPAWLARRQKIAARYDEALTEIPGIESIGLRKDVMTGKQSLEYRAHKDEGLDVHTKYPLPSMHAYHLYVVRINEDELGRNRKEFFQSLRSKSIGANVHYIPVHLHPFYRNKFGDRRGLCPVAEEAYEQIISLPIHPDLSEEQLDYVIEEIRTTSIS